MNLNVSKLFSAVALAGTTFAASTILSSPANAADYDMDCKVILCFVGGFPSGCGDAKSYMYKRLRKGKSPFGTCSTSDGGDYDNYDLSVNRLTGTGSYYCEPPKELHLLTSVSQERGGQTNTSVVRDYCQSPTGGQSSTIRPDWQIQVTVEPGSDVSYSSETFTVDTNQGQVYEGVGIRHISRLQTEYTAPNNGSNR